MVIRDNTHINCKQLLRKLQITYNIRIHHNWYTPNKLQNKINSVNLYPVLCHCCLLFILAQHYCLSTEETKSFQKLKKTASEKMLMYQQNQFQVSPKYRVLIY